MPDRQKPAIGNDTPTGDHPGAKIGKADDNVPLGDAGPVVAGKADAMLAAGDPGRDRGTGDAITGGAGASEREAPAASAGSSGSSSEPFPSASALRFSPIGDLCRAIILLSRLPLRFDGDFSPASIARSVWCWPLVGVVLAGLALIPAMAAGYVMGNDWIVAIIATAVMVMLTGGLHEDGLADCADGFGGGRDRARKLEIMRDSRIGSYGVIALVLALAMRLVLLAQAQQGGFLPVMMLVMVVLSRSAMPVVLCILPPARPDGLGRGAGRPHIIMLVLCIAIAGGLAIVVAGFVAGAVAMLAAMLAAGIVAITAHRHIGGHSGDVLGATQILAELVAGMAIIAIMAGRYAMA